MHVTIWFEIVRNYAIYVVYLHGLLTIDYYETPFEHIKIKFF